MTSVAFSPVDTKIVSGSWDETIRIWDVETGQQIGEPFTGHIGAVNSVALSRDGTIVSGSNDATIRIWAVDTGSQIEKPLTGHIYGVTSVALSRDGTKIVSGGVDGTSRIWDLENHLCTICESIRPCVINCDFRNAEFNGKDESEFYRIIYSNGGIVKDKFIPKPVPFDFLIE